MSDKEIELLPCPFCGESGPEISEGSTHRWMQISCCGEVRKADIMLPASHPVNMKLAAEVWNTRSARSEASAWVPVSERLPEQSGVFYVTFPNGTVGRCAFYCGAFDNSIHAWMPLPSPYTADSGKEKGECG